ncbi:hypothetical protein [Streptomyces sp. NPDC045470]|uniref:hypothetical protein n=1 Tax=Streptomyces sp. NPDC045470 TaxID=3155469 RepID=UPI00340D7A9F
MGSSRSPRNAGTRRNRPRRISAVDDIALTQARRGDFFGIRWKLVNTFVHGHFTSAFSAGDQSHFEHRANGAVRGKLGCINFTAEAKPGESCFSLTQGLDLPAAESGLRFSALPPR